MAFADAMHDMREEMHDLTHITHLDAARQAYAAMWGVFVVVPLLFGLDKVAGFLGVTWGGYLADWVHAVIPGGDARDVTLLGIVEILLACAVALNTRLGGAFLAIYLVLAALSAFTIGGGMVVLGVLFLAAAVCSFAMARMSTTFHRR